jgi:glycosyltransferase involved in cell wall biosynthesis
MATNTAEPTGTSRPQLSVIIPVFNEVTTVERIVNAVRSVPVDKEIVIVDDASTDGSREVLERLANAADERLRILHHDENRGKTAALRTGIAAARGEIIIVQDADLEYDPSEYPRLIQPIQSGRADVVYGSRFLGSPRRVLMFWHTVGNKFLTLLSNMFTNLNLTDMETCYKAFRADVLKSIPIRSERFGFEPEITAKVARMRCRIFEVPISYSGRQYWEGKKITWKDGFHAIWTIVRCAVVDDMRDVNPGHLTLRRVERLQRYNRYLCSRVAPYVGTRVLEVGSGTGNMTRHFANRSLLVATDVAPEYLDLLRRSFERNDNVVVERFDLSGALDDRLARYEIDTIMCLNVLEHVEDDEAALGRFHELLPDAGRLILLVPMLPALYGAIDRALHHYRRYARAELLAKCRRAGFEIEHVSALNVLGIAGWYLNSRVLRRTAVPGIQAKLNDYLVPVFRLEERLRPRVGMSLLVVARRSGGRREPTTRAAVAG